MRVPSVPMSRMLDERGELTQAWILFFDELVQQLAETVTRFNYNDSTNKMELRNGTADAREIYLRPQQLTSAEIAAIPTADINGTWVFDTTASKLYYGINDAFHEVAYT